MVSFIVSAEEREIICLYSACADIASKYLFSILQIDFWSSVVRALLSVLKFKNVKSVIQIYVQEVVTYKQKDNSI